jgi:dihydrofolate synthase/folylpolyglutamate synthase
MDYREALRYLDSFVNFERQPQTRGIKALITLDRVRALAGQLGNPQDRFPSLHVAGTKGKGSTCALAQAILTAAGLKAGLYTSPHLQDVRERICIGGRKIPRKVFARLLSDCLPALEAMRMPPPGERRATYFEVLTHLAFTWFAEANVDVALVEVGMGGRLDATNIITPVACGVTNISYDHQAILGNTLPLIAREKAGIMKPDVPVVVARQVDEVTRTLEECAAASGAPCELVGREIKLRELQPPASGLQPSSWPLPRGVVELPGGAVYEAELGLRGSHQLENWAVAARLADLFFQRTRGARIPADAVREGSRQVRWRGRLEEIEPRVFLDGAHNDHSLRTVLNELRRQFPAPVVLFGCAKDKNAEAMLKVLAEARVAEVLFTHSGNSRGRDPQELAALWTSETGGEARACVRCADGLAAARDAAGAAGVVLVTGSLYLVGAVRDVMAGSKSRAMSG